MTARQSGFTLLEVLVALLVLSVTIVAVLELFGGGLRLARASADHVGATLVAAARLAEVAPGPLEEGTTEGEEGNYRWVRRVALDPSLRPVEPTAVDADLVQVARVAVEVQWGRGRRLELVTLRTWRTVP